MPVVSAGSATVDFEIERVKSGTITLLSGFLDVGREGFVAAVFAELKPSGKLDEQGLTLTATALVPGGTLPAKYNRPRIRVHLCTELGSKVILTPRWNNCSC